MDWGLLFVIFVFVMGIGFIVMMNHAKDLTEQRDTLRTQLHETVAMARKGINAVYSGEDRNKWHDAIPFYASDDCNLVEANKKLHQEMEKLSKRNAKLNKFNREDILDMED